jgi:hypothetical protein
MTWRAYRRRSGLDVMLNNSFGMQLAGWLLLVVSFEVSRIMSMSLWGLQFHQEVMRHYHPDFEIRNDVNFFIVVSFVAFFLTFVSVLIVTPKYLVRPAFMYTNSYNELHHLEQLMTTHVSPEEFWSTQKEASAQNFLVLFLLGYIFPFVIIVNAPTAFYDPSTSFLGYIIPLPRLHEIEALIISYICIVYNHQYSFAYHGRSWEQWKELIYLILGLGVATFIFAIYAQHYHRFSNLSSYKPNMLMTYSGYIVLLVGMSVGYLWKRWTLKRLIIHFPEIMERQLGELSYQRATPNQ